MPSSTSHSRPIFYLIMLLLPIVILLVIEGGLRLAGYGKTYPLFVAADKVPGYLQPNPDIVQRYFADPRLAPKVSPDTLLFKGNKADDSFRIVVMGGSTAAGFPLGRFGSLTGMLQQRLKRLYPDKDIEVISTAMASINSYALLDFVDEVIDIEPDLVMIYAGHNEYLGIMGVGSAYAGWGGLATNRAFLVIKEWRLYQLLQQLYVALMLGDKGDVTTADAHTLMASIARDKAIVQGSDSYQLGKIQFQQNMNSVLERLGEAGISTIIGTLAANEKDQPPFVSKPGVDTTALTAAIDKTLWQQGQELGSALLQSANDSAQAHYLYAQALYGLQQDSEAAYHFTRARDLDQLRFRAPSEFNAIIKDLAETNNALIAEVEQTMQQTQRGGIIGDELMYEHLHPNQRGYFLLAEAYVDVLVKNRLLAETPIRVSPQQAWRDVPLTEPDRLYADFKIRQLTSDYPFTDQPVKVEFKASNDFAQQLTLKRLQGENWLSQQQQMLSHYQRSGNITEAAKVAGVMFDALPYNAQAANVASLLYLNSNDLVLAYYHGRKAVALKPENVSYLMTLAEIQFKRQLPQQSAELLRQVLVLEPGHTKARQYLQFVTGQK